MKASPQNTGEFIQAFRDYLDCFVVIGGTPTLLYIEQREGTAPRVTKDLDIVILDIAEEGRGRSFLKRFSNYIEKNGYECKQLSSGKAQSYRFTDPKSKIAPQIIEISTRRKDGIPLQRTAQRLEEFEMSAIVCEPYFIDLLKNHHEAIPINVPPSLSLPVAKVSLLILMKAYAVENLQRSEKREDRTKVKKHLNDILRLTRVLVEGDRLKVPANAFKHLEAILSEQEKHFSRSRLDACGWRGQKAMEVETILRDFIKSS